MFDQLVVSSVQKNRTNKPWTVTLSALIQVAIVGIMILIPLIYTEALPTGMLSTFLVAPPPPPPPPPPAPKTQPIVRPRIVTPQRMVAPTVIPKNIAIVKDAAPDIASTGVEGGVPGGIGGGVLSGILAAPPPPKPVTPQRIRVGGNVQAASLVHQVQPIYPQIARTAHISGTVILHAIIAKDGTIQELSYVTGPALLMRSAMDAVREWRYKPTLLNGEPVEVETTISVEFTLGGG